MTSDASDSLSSKLEVRPYDTKELVADSVRQNIVADSFVTRFTVGPLTKKATSAGDTLFEGEVCEIGIVAVIAGVTNRNNITRNEYDFCMRTTINYINDTNT